ncbi:hypothetical protein M422DRAFT_249510 [Sphaerobolus stellatus SS14]|uniref:Uncharacterized protein n=1 Tax=Sphaerobolus stellatus (strain SS14) TaxID=990650 RepID=A0A0C9VUV1_SPHS4|nr:hypothetical protein M422DRAFT_249510 [Sphaerobolus stellatus SS14]
MSVTQIWGTVLLSEADKNTTESNDASYAYYKCVIPLTHSKISATVRLHTSSLATVFTNDIMVLLYGHFTYSSCRGLLIEALRLISFPYPIANEPVYLNLFIPRFTIIGYVIGHPSDKDHAVMFTVTSISYVFGSYQSVTVIAVIVPGVHWPKGPPIPKPQSPVHIMGTLQRIEKASGTPIILVDDMTLEIGNVKIRNLSTQAFESLNPMTLRDGISPDSGYNYEPSSIALGAVNDYGLQEYSVKNENTQYNLNVQHSGNLD